MNTKKITLAAFASIMFGACNLDNADNPSNSVSTADTTTTAPDPMETDPVLVPFEVDTTGDADTGMQNERPAS